jgi:hypothetical protein
MKTENKEKSYKDSEKQTNIKHKNPRNYQRLIITN